MNKLIINNKDNVLDINEDSLITIFNTNIKSLDLNIFENTKVIINDFRIINKSSTNININIKDNSNLIYNHSFINENKYNLNVNTNYKGNNSEITFNIHGINEKGISNINFDGILNNNINNTLLENIKLINIKEGTGVVIPNILVSNNEVVANHKATIGFISKEELNYLMSKGISKKEAEYLILTGFLINIFEDKKLITNIKELINWRDKNE